MTTRIKLIVLAMILVVGLAARSWSQTDEGYGFVEGNWEFTLSGSGSSDKDFDTTALSVEGSLGYFMTDRFELVLRQGIGVADNTEDSDWNGSTRVGFDYHFGGGRLYPFVGATIGYLYGDSTEESWIAGPEAGIKYFLGEQSFLYGAVEYQFLFEDTDDADDAFDDGRFVYVIGMGYKW